MELGHILDSNQSREELDKILKETARMKRLCQNDRGKDYLKEALKHKEVVLLFYQPSTRTRSKFEIAAKRLGAETIVINEVSHTSIVKGESWQNTIKSFANEGANLIIVRHPDDFKPHQAAEVCDRYGFATKIINAGDGKNLHPSQAILDLFTLREHFGERFSKDILKIAIGADLKNARVAHSLVAVLAQYPVRLSLVSFPHSKISPEYLYPLHENQREFSEITKLSSSKKMDAIYWFRYQIEHGDEKQRQSYNAKYRITTAYLRKYLKEDGGFFHPGPRDGEIDDNIDSDPRVKDGIQVANGVFSSMALLKMMLNPKFCVPRPSEI